MLRAFWRQLADTVHPADKAVFAQRGHTYNLDYPPPAFVGDPSALVVLLYSNGGYDPKLTPQEFAAPGAADLYRRQLSGDATGLPGYYRDHALGDLLTSGLAVRVNAVAYRSRQLSREPDNMALAEQLPSGALHRKWLREEVLPQALLGRRFVIVHRNGMWRLDRGLAGPTIVFSKNPVSTTPSKSSVARAREWLSKR